MYTNNIHPSDIHTVSIYILKSIILARVQPSVRYSINRNFHILLSDMRKQMVYESRK